MRHATDKAVEAQTREALEEARVRWGQEESTQKPPKPVLSVLSGELHVALGGRGRHLPPSPPTPCTSRVHARASDCVGERRDAERAGAQVPRDGQRGGRGCVAARSGANGGSRAGEAGVRGSVWSCGSSSSPSHLVSVDSPEARALRQPRTPGGNDRRRVVGGPNSRGLGLQGCRPREGGEPPCDASTPRPGPMQLCRRSGH